ncbi:MAG TPA: hypothetical protein VHG72_12905 [Polyangia bacterium]|nr:hypothetical protein [Polyangia bacterium]
MTFTVLNRELVITDGETGEPLWSGRLQGLPVEQAQQIDATTEAIVLLDYAAAPSGPSQNLVRVHSNGEIAWTADLPTSSSTDAYVAFELDGEVLAANSWSGHRVHLDRDTGRIVDRVFTK